MLASVHGLVILVLLWSKIIFELMVFNLIDLIWSLNIFVLICWFGSSYWIV